MKNSFAIHTVVIALSLMAGNVGAEQPVPVVYEDDYVTVHAGLSESGSKAVHIGDTLSLVIAVVFDPGRVQIESLDDKVFQRAFSDSPSIHLHSSAMVTTRKGFDGRVTATSYWRLQILDCPDDLATCPGFRSYELPLMTVAYQLVGNASTTTDGRAARFRPWPGKIDLAPAVAIVAESDAKLGDILPGGAYDKQQAIGELAPARSSLFLAAAILLLAAYFARVRSHQPKILKSRPSESNSRWEQALARLSDDTISDDEFSDLLRRCITWFCLDELGRNPYTWLGESAGLADSPLHVQEFFLDVLQQQGIESGRRASYLDKLSEATGRVRDAVTDGQQT
jgi:hypothetical protein